MALKKPHLSLLAFGVCLSSMAQTTLDPITINIDENTKSNTTIGQINFVDGQSDASVTIEVGTAHIKNWSTNGEAFEPVSFATSFTSAPIVFGQIQSASDYQIDYTIDSYSYSGATRAIGQDFIMRHRMNNVSATGFDAILESQLDKRGTSVVTSIDNTGTGETLGWLAVSSPLRAVVHEKQFEVLSTGQTVTHHEYGQQFASPFTDTPNFISTISTYNGSSQSGVAVADVTANRAKLFIDNLDDDSHNAENVNLMAVEDGAFFVSPVSAIFGETGSATVNDSARDEPFTIRLQKQFNDPVVFVQAVGIDKTIIDAAVRLTNVSNNSFSAYLHSDVESVAPARFGQFTLYYQVFEAGTWELPLEHYSYEIVAGNETGAFSVDAVSGKIKVADQTLLDFESGNNQFVFTVRVKDGVGNHYDTQVTINVNDINDSLNNTAQIIEGINAQDWAGWGVAPAGDVNGDGYDDIIVGVPQDDSLGTDNGAAYVFFSDASGQLPTLAEVRNGTRGFAILGAANGDNAGFSVAGGVDINGDGLSDLVVGAPYADVNGDESGSAYVVFGKADTGYVNLADLVVNGGNKGFAMHGAYTKDFAGGTLVVGDVNGDGLGDVVIGETVTRFLAGTGAFELNALSDEGNADPNLAYVVYGKADGAALNLAQIADDTNNAGFSISRASRTMFSGWNYGAQVLPTGDFNSDGLTDFIVSNGLYGDNAGNNFVVFGRVGGKTVNYNSIKSDGNGIKISPEGGNYGFDFSKSTLNALPSFTTSNVGDVNADGVDDIALLLTDAGCCEMLAHPRAYILFGGVNVAEEINLAAIAQGIGGFVIDNDASNVNHHDLMVILGSIGGAGDLNGDGFDDIIIGDPFAEDNKGRVYAVYGRAGTAPVYLSEIIETSQGFYSEGNGGEQLGQFIASAGDINGDGIKDIQFGTPSANTNNLNNNGAVYILKGDGNKITSWGSVGNDSFSGSASAQLYATGVGDDLVAGKGGADVIYTGPGNDTIVINDTDFVRIDGGGGTDTLTLDGAGISLNLATASSKVRSIEVFDIRGSGANVLSLNKSVSGNANLRILGDADDSVKAANNQWQDTSTVVIIDNVEYALFNAGSAQMLVQKGVAVEINNEPSIAAQIFTVSEYSQGGTVLGAVAASANDVGDFVRYSILSGNDSGSFTIDATSGQLAIASSVSRLDYETQSSYALEVQVTDNYGAIAQATVTVNVNDVEFISHTLSADLSATESTFGSTAFTDILHVATMNHIGSQYGISESISSTIKDDSGVTESWNPDWNKKVDDYHHSSGDIFSIDLEGEFYFEPRFGMQTGQVISDIPVQMDLAYADEVQAGQETLITAKFEIDNYANFIATSPAFDITFGVGVKDLYYRIQSDIILDNNDQPLDKEVSLDEGTNSISLKSDEITVVGRHCLQTLGQPACLIGTESDEQQPLRISASIDAKNWFEQELFTGTTWRTYFYGTVGQAITHETKECREDFFYPAGEDLYYNYKFEMLDTFVSLHADIKQDFYLEVRPISKLTLEDGTVLVFKGDEDIAFTPELHHDVNNDGVIDANLTVNVYSVFYNDTKTSVGARMPFKMGLANWNVQEAVCSGNNIHLYQQAGAIYEKGQFGPAFDFEFSFLVEEMSLTEWKWDEAAATLASPFIKKSESTEPLPPYLYNDNEWLLAHEKLSKNIAFDLCNQEGSCGEPILSFHNNAPKAENVSVSGAFIAKDTVTANYDYSDYEGDLEVGSIYQWFSASDNQGTDATAIEGEVYQSYSLAVQDIDNYIQFCVKPFDGKKYGNIVCSSWQQVASPFYKNFSILTGFGKAIDLNGVDQSLWQNTAHLLNVGSDSYTVEMWLNIEDYNTEKPINVLTFNSGSSTAALRIMSDGRLRTKATDTTFFSTEAISQNTWHHVAITYEQANSKFVVYLDGEPVISQTDTSASRDVDLIWGANSTQSDRFVDGKFDELRLWNVAKSQEEIQANRFLAVDANAANLVSYINFDNDEADFINDLTGNSQITAANGTSFVTHNTALSFDGDGDYFNVPYSSSALNWGGESFTAQAWIYLAPGSGGTTRSIINKKLSSASGHNGWSFKVNSSNKLEIHLKPVDGSQTLAAGSALATGRWYHAAVTVDRELKKLKLYVNGELKGQQNLSNKTNINSSYPLRLGAYSGTGVNNHNFAGQMDNVAIWNRVLSQDELKMCMNGMAFGCEQDLFLYYDFEDSSGKNKAVSGFDGSVKGNAEFVVDGLYNEFTVKANEPFIGVLPLGEGVSMEVISAPNHGQFYLNEYTGAFEYTSHSDSTAVSDSFTYIVYDPNDGYSTQRTVAIHIQ